MARYQIKSKPNRGKAIIQRIPLWCVKIEDESPFVATSESLLESGDALLQVIVRSIACEKKTGGCP